MRRVSIFVLNYNGKDLLAEYLPSIVSAVEYDGGDHEVVVVDNASSDDSVEFVRKNFPYMRVRVMTKNRRLFSYNEVIAECQRDYVMVLNNDVEMKEGSLSPLLRHFDDPYVFAVTPRMLSDDKKSGNHIPYRIYGVFRWGNLHTSRILAEYGKEKLDPPLFNLHAHGGASVFHRKRFLELGGFNEIYWPEYMQDNDISYLAWLRGWKIIFEPTSEVYHIHGATLKKIYSDNRRQQILFKNSMIFVLKNFNDPELLTQFFVWWGYRFLKALLKEDRARLGAFLDVIMALPRICRERKKVQALRRYSDRQILHIIQRNSFKRLE